jgi:hypothetical protein
MSLVIAQHEPAPGLFSVFHRMRVESARRSAIRAAEKHLRRAQLAMRFGDFRLARRALVKAMAACNTAKAGPRSEIFRAMNYCQQAARRAEGGRHA